MSDDVIQKAAEAMWAAIDDKGILGRLCREDCDYLAQALADAGLLPTEQAWGVQHPDLDVVLVLSRTGRPLASREEATAHAQQFADGPATVVTRRFTPWKDAS